MSLRLRLGLEREREMSPATLVACPFDVVVCRRRRCRRRRCTLACNARAERRREVFGDPLIS